MELPLKAHKIEHRVNLTRITVRGGSEHGDASHEVFERLASNGIDVDLILKNSKPDGSWDLSFTVAGEHANHALEAVRPLAGLGRIGELGSEANLGRVSLVGTAMRDAPGYAARMFQVLASQDINIKMISTSDIQITCVISGDRVEDAVHGLRGAFLLDE